MVTLSRVELARKRRRITAKSLAETLGISAVALSRILSGLAQPPADFAENLERVLGYPRDFFFKCEVDEIDVRAASFRSLTAMTAKERDACLAAGFLAFEISMWVKKIFDLPSPDLLDLSSERSPSNAARALRSYWGIGEKPIGNMIHFLESKGVRVFSLSENTKNIDAFSCWRNDEPYIFLNTFKTTERSRFDAAHELGHLVLHKHGGPNQKDAENQANSFASAFLMPEADVVSTLPYANRFKDLVQAKRRWGVSVAALAYRLHKLELMSDWNYRNTMITLNKEYARSEPEPLSSEKSYVWHVVLSELWKEKKTIDSIAAELRTPVEEIGSLIFALAFDNTKKFSGGPLRLVDP